MNEITVRQAVLADLGPLSVLFDDYRQFQGQESDVGAAAGFLRERFDHGESVVFIAATARAALGFAQIYPSFSSVSLRRVFVLNDLFVVGPARRKGIASQLLDAVEAYALALRAGRVALNVACGNDSAQALHAARGWKRDIEFLMFHRHLA